MKVTLPLILAVVTISVGSGFQHGYNIGVLNSPEEMIKKWVGDQMDAKDTTLSLYWSTIVSLLPFGGLVGGAFTKLVCDNLGRKGGLILNAGLAIIAGVILGITKLTNTSIMLFIGRFIIGVNSGLNAGIAPLFITEISPTKIRGAMGSLYQLNITISILISNVLGFEVIMGRESLWPLLLALVAVVGLLQGIVLFFCQESPKFLLEKKQDEGKAREACEKLMGEEFQQQFTELKNDIEDAKKLPSVTIKEMFTEKKLRTPLIIILVLMTAQQLSGINAVMFYSTEIFKMAKFSNNAAQISTIGVGLVNVITTIFSVWLVEVSGRKLLLLIAFGGMVLCMLGLFICLYFVENHDVLGYVCIVKVYLYVICFAIGAGSVPWILGPEMFNTASRALACSFAVVANWGWAFVVGLIFPPLREIMGPAVFIIFIACNVAAFAFIWIFCPETKNKSIDEITAQFE